MDEGSPSSGTEIAASLQFPPSLPIPHRKCCKHESPPRLTMKRATEIMTLLAFSFACGPFAIAVPAGNGEIAAIQSPKWVLDEAQLLVSAEDAYKGASGTIELAKAKGLFDETLRKLSYEQNQAIFQVAWYVVAIGEYGSASTTVDALLKKIDVEMGEILIPPWICAPEAYQQNIDALALKHRTLDFPFPEPAFRPLSKVVEEARTRMAARSRRSGKPKK